MVEYRKSLSGSWFFKIIDKRMMVAVCNDSACTQMFATSVDLPFLGSISMQEALSNSITNKCTEPEYIEAKKLADTTINFISLLGK